MGCAPPAISIIASLVCPSNAPRSRTEFDPSGPRCERVSSALETFSGGTWSASGPTMPRIPHILLRRLHTEFKYIQRYEQVGNLREDECRDTASHSIRIYTHNQIYKFQHLAARY